MYDKLKRHYDFASWQGVTTLPLHLLLWHYRPRGTELHDWEIGSIRVLTLPHTPRFLPSMWRQPGGSRKNSLRLDTYECDSREAAHETLIHLLGEFSAPVMRRLIDTGFGDISFGGRDLSAVLFARANLVFLMAKAGRTPLTVTTLARELDHDLITRPTPATMHHVEPAPVACAISGPSSLIDLDTTASRGTLAQPYRTDAVVAPQHKLFSQNCELCAEEDLIRAVPLKAGQQEVEIYTLESAGGWERRDVTIEDVKQ